MHQVQVRDTHCKQWSLQCQEETFGDPLPRAVSVAPAEGIALCKRSLASRICIRQAGLQIEADVQRKNPEYVPYKVRAESKMNLTIQYLKEAREDPDLPMLNEREDTDDLSIVCL